jgi:TonB-dependent receptor
MKPFCVKRKTLSVSITAAILGTLSLATHAQDTSADAEEIVITGIRASLTSAMDIKRNATGVVDAISAEDIGKMPDTNLAESLQRITGVSIDRQNNEGSKVTVRGFGPEYNMITLNGRIMPAANIEATAASTSRSYDFANLAAEAVAGVEVYKTGKASLTTGGIGSTINIKTGRPLDNLGLHTSFGVKMVDDTSTRIGDKYTPEVSGIYSNTFADNKIGVALTGSIADRNSNYNAGEVSSGWNTSRANASSPIVDVPQNFLYSFNDVTRKRTNGQLVLQWAATDTLKTTLDYTYSDLDIEQRRQELGAWFGSGASTGTKWSETTAANVRSPQFLNNNDCCDIGLGTGSWGTRNLGLSTGLNIDWKASDNLKLALDYHNSSARATPKDARGSNNIVTAAGYLRTNATVDFDHFIPILSIKSAKGGLNPDMIIATGTSFRNGYMKTEIEQLQLDGSYKFDDGIVKSVDFGVGNTDAKNRSAFSLNQGGNWGGVGYTYNAGNWNASAGDGDGNFDNKDFNYQSISDLNKKLGGTGAGVNGNMIWVDYNKFSRDLAEFYLRYPNGQGAFGNASANCVPGTLCTDPVYSVDRHLEEKTQAAYTQANLGFDIGAMPAVLNLGLRYEKTDTTSNFLLPNYTSQIWLTPNEIQLSTDANAPFTHGTGDGNYSNWLPNIDFGLDVRDNIKFRASVSQTLAKPNFAELQGGATPDGSQARSFDASSASAGDANLLPFKSTNFDLSAEWYYSEGSYVSLGYYRKDVKNFIGTTVYQKAIYANLKNPASGTRLAQAAAAVVDPNNRNQEIHNYYVAKGWIGSDGSLIGDTSSYDPLTYTVRAPVNNKEASIDGFEFAVQHVFGDSGFGGIINYTTVNGDISYDNSQIGINQFALLGLSDSANLVAFYDKDGVQVRVAYNWRDAFLSATVGGNGQQEPAYTEAYGQVDLSASYQFNENFSVQLEGINVLEAGRRVHARTQNAVIYAANQEARYGVGARYKF